MPIVQHDDAVALTDGAQSVGDGDAGAFHLRKILGYNVLADVVECRCSLVEEQNLWLADDGACYQDALSLTSRHALSVGRYVRVESVGHAFDVVFECHLANGLPHIVIVQSGITEQDVLADGSLHQVAVLQTDAHAVLSQTGFADVVEVMLVVEDRSALGLLESQQQSHQCALAAARRAYQCYVFAGVDAQIQSVEQVWHIVGIAEFQSVHGYVSAGFLEEYFVFVNLRVGHEYRCA